MPERQSPEPGHPACLKKSRARTKCLSSRASVGLLLKVERTCNIPSFPSKPGSLFLATSVVSHLPPHSGSSPRPVLQRHLSWEFLPPSHSSPAQTVVPRSP